MKITKQMLKNLIKEELETLEEMGAGPMMPEDEEGNEGHGGAEDEEDMHAGGERLNLSALGLDADDKIIFKKFITMLKNYEV